MGNGISNLMKGRIDDEKREAKRVEEENTRSSIVHIISNKAIVGARSRVVIIEEEIKLLKGRRVNSDGGHGEWIVRFYYV